MGNEREDTRANVGVRFIEPVRRIKNKTRGRVNPLPCLIKIINYSKNILYFPYTYYPHLYDKRCTLHARLYSLSTDLTGRLVNRSTG